VSDATARQLELLGSYRDRVIHAIGEARGIGCVTDECSTAFPIPTILSAEVDQVVDGLCGVLWMIQNALDKGAGGSCQHENVTPTDPMGAYVCDDCGVTLARYQCSVCNQELLDHLVAAHVTERCWEA